MVIENLTQLLGHNQYSIKTVGDYALTIFVKGDVHPLSMLYLRFLLLFGQIFPSVFNHKKSQIIAHLIEKQERDTTFSLFPASNEERIRTLQRFAMAELEQLPPQLVSFEERFDEIDFLRRIPQKERTLIMAEIARLEKPLTDDQLKAFYSGEWSHPVFKQKNWSFLAFHAYLKGKLDAIEISKLFLYQQCLFETSAERPARVHQLVKSDGSLDNEAFSLIEKGLDNYYSKEEREDLKACLVEMPFHETQFFSVDSPAFRPPKKGEPMDIAAYLLHKCKFRFLFVKEGAHQGAQLILPPGLLYELFQIKFGSNTIMPNPVLGFFKKERFSLPDRRSVSIPFQVVSQPDQIHRKLMCTPLSIYFHDSAYHLFLDSSNAHRKAWIELALLCTNDYPDAKIELLDRDFPLYVRSDLQIKLTGKKLFSSEEKFWYSLAMLFSNPRREFHNNEPLKSLLLNHIATHASHWNEDFDLDFTRLPQLQDNEIGLQEVSLVPIMRFYRQQGLLKTPY